MEKENERRIPQHVQSHFRASILDFPGLPMLRRGRLLIVIQTNFVF